MKVEKEMIISNHYGHIYFCACDTRNEHEENVENL